jgi:hypothetical protein
MAAGFTIRAKELSMHKFHIGKFYRSPANAIHLHGLNIVKCIDWSPSSVVWKTSNLDFYVTTYNTGMKYLFLPDCDRFDWEEFPQYYILDTEKQKPWGNMCRWVLKRTSSDCVTRYELKDDTILVEEQDWHEKADCWKLVSEEEAMCLVRLNGKIRTSLWSDPRNGIVIQADIMPDDRFKQLKFNAEGVYYEGEFT